MGATVSNGDGFFWALICDWYFLLDRVPSNIEKALDRFGSRLLRWEVEPPTAEEQLLLRKEGMAEGLEFQVERVLSRMKPNGFEW